MVRIRSGTVGILPAGALGVSLFYHLTRELTEVDGDIFFIERTGSRSAGILRDQHSLRIVKSGRVVEVGRAGIWRGDLLQCHAEGWLPEVVLICPNPDQLLSSITTVVDLLQRIFAENAFRPGEVPLPILVLSSNGIYFQRVRQIFIEKLEEATLFGTLPDLWPDLMPGLVGRLLRGITIQTGIREGTGAGTVYHPGARGITRVAGGGAEVRRRACELLSGRGGWFELAENSSPTRLEFDKALVNLTSNFLGQLYAIDDAGRFKLMTVGEIVTGEHEAEIQQLTRMVLAVGIAVKAYPPDQSFEATFNVLWETCRIHRDHVPSSLQWVDLLLREKQLRARMTPTEQWILEPLIRYARSAGLEEAVRYFEELHARLIERLGRAIAWGS